MGSGELGDDGTQRIGDTHDLRTCTVELAGTPSWGPEGVDGVVLSRPMFGRHTNGTPATVSATLRSG